MALSAHFVEDPLTHIVSITIGAAGAVFIYGTSPSNKLYYASFRNSSDSDPVLKTIELPEPPQEEGDRDLPSFGITGGSYHTIVGPTGERKPTFLLCGQRLVPDAAGEYALIYASNDGQEWREVFRFDAETADVTIKRVSPMALVWTPDSEAFFYDQNYLLRENIHEPERAHSFDQIYTSADGFLSWTLVSSTDVGGNDNAFLYQSVYPPTYCAHNRPLDAYGQHVPDGVTGKTGTGENELQAYTQSTPAYNYWAGTIGFSEMSPDVIVVKDPDGTPHTITVPVPGVNRLAAVAAASGILMAGGFVTGGTGAIAFSLDGGATWTPLPATPSEITIIIAGESA